MMDGLIENRKFIYEKHPLLTQFNELTEEAATPIHLNETTAALKVVTNTKKKLEDKIKLISEHQDFFIKYQALELEHSALEKQRRAIDYKRDDLLNGFKNHEGRYRGYFGGGLFTVSGILALSLMPTLSATLGVGLPFLIAGLALIVMTVVIHIKEKRDEKKEAKRMQSEMDTLEKEMNEKLSEMDMLCKKNATPEAPDNVGLLSSLPFFDLNNDKPESTVKSVVSVGMQTI